MKPIGRLAEQIAYHQRIYDAGSKLARAFERGLLPNPPAGAPAATKLNAQDYGLLLAIIDRLDAVASPAVTEGIVKQVGLNGEEATSAQIKAAHAGVMAADLPDKVERATVTTIMEAISK